eukprot:6451582-Amphidinium_carterae.1
MDSEMPTFKAAGHEFSRTTAPTYTNDETANNISKVSVFHGFSKEVFILHEGVQLLDVKGCLGILQIGGPILWGGLGCGPDRQKQHICI